MTKHNERIALARHPAMIAWAALMLATAISWWLGSRHDVFNGGKAVTAAAILAIAFIKVHFVGMYFMDLREAPVLLRRIFNAWTLGTCAVLIGLYLWAVH